MSRDREFRKWLKKRREARMQQKLDQYIEGDDIEGER